MAERAISGHLELLYPSEYVKAADLRGKDVTVIVDHLTWENLVMAGGKKDRKVTVHMRSVSGKALEKRWVVGKTVLRQIASALGETDVAKWTGGKITIWPTTCRGADGKTVECIRVRQRANQHATDITEEMAATPAPRSSFLDEVADDEKPPSEPPPPAAAAPAPAAPAPSEAKDLTARAVAARSENEIKAVAADFEAAKGRMKSTEATKLRTFIESRLESLAGVVAPDAEPGASS